MLPDPYLAVGGAVGLIVAFYFLIPIFWSTCRFAWEFVDDGPMDFKVPEPPLWPGKWRPRMSNGDRIFESFMGAFVGGSAGFLLWPLVVLCLAVAIPLVILRFLMRCGKSVRKLAEVAHSHDEHGNPKPTYVEKPKIRGDYL